MLPNNGNQDASHALDYNRVTVCRSFPAIKGDNINTSIPKGSNPPLSTL
jgi:hypothetical protein